MPILVQTDSLVIDVAEITHIAIGRGGAITIHFSTGEPVKMPAAEAVGLMAEIAAMGKERALFARRATPASATDESTVPTRRFVPARTVEKSR